MLVVFIKHYLFSDFNTLNEESNAEETFARRQTREI